MADTKIINLTALTAASAVDGDLFVIEDASANVTKKMTVNEMRLLLMSKAVESRVAVYLLDIGTPVAVQDGVGEINFYVPSSLNNLKLSLAHAAVDSISTSGTPTFQIYNITKAVDMLSTRMIIDANERATYTAATQPVINPANATVNTGDRLRFDCDVAGTGTKGLVIFLEFTAA